VDLTEFQENLARVRLQANTLTLQARELRRRQFRKHLRAPLFQEGVRHSRPSDRVESRQEFHCQLIDVAEFEARLATAATRLIGPHAIQMVALLSHDAPHP
jgi:hypothetical protein